MFVPSVEHGGEGGPGELDGHAEREQEADDGEEVVVQPLEEDPHQRRHAQHAGRDLLVPPQQHVGGCSHSIVRHHSSQFIHKERINL